MKLEAKIEALLFTAGKPLAVSYLSETCKVAGADIEITLRNMQQSWRDTERGVALVWQGKKVQMVTAPELGELVAAHLKAEINTHLSTSALETLAIVAYRQPVIRMEVDAIRGVNSGIMLRTLMIRGLVDRRKSSKDARAMEYALSLQCMRHLGLSNKEALPKYEELIGGEAMRAITKSVEDATKAEAPAELKKQQTSEAKPTNAVQEENAHD